MAPTAATKARTNRAAKPETEAEQDKQLSDVKDEKTGKTLTIQQLKNKLRNEAEREVLDKHKDEVVTITAAKYKAHNLEYVRRLTDAEKAEKAIEEHLAAHPELRDRLAAKLALTDAEDNGDYAAVADAAEHLDYVEKREGE